MIQKSTYKIVFSSHVFYFHSILFSLLGIIELCSQASLIVEALDEQACHLNAQMSALAKAVVDSVAQLEAYVLGFTPYVNDMLHRKRLWQRANRVARSYASSRRDNSREERQREQEDRRHAALRQKRQEAKARTQEEQMKGQKAEDQRQDEEEEQPQREQKRQQQQQRQQPRLHKEEKENEESEVAEAEQIRKDDRYFRTGQFYPNHPSTGYCLPSYVPDKRADKDAICTKVCTLCTSHIDKLSHMMNMCTLNEVQMAGRVRIMLAHM
jgi:flagellar biosynthesis GTPase FlhF